MDKKPMNSIALASACAFAVFGSASLYAGSQTGGYQSQSSMGGSASSTMSTYGTASFQELDQNQDGYVNRDEIEGQANAEERFSQADHDQDGKLSRAEFSAFEAESESGSHSEMESHPGSKSETDE